jgi:PPOX class probable FMN-dependent enzyme
MWAERSSVTVAASRPVRPRLGDRYDRAVEVRSTITDEAALRALIGGEPQAVVVSKISDRLNDLTRQFVERAPFVCLATSAPDGSCDVSPRGDPAGFVRILDERTLLLPDRPGNRIADSLRNILVNPYVGLLFVIPGVGDSFRVNGRAVLTDDAELLAPSEVDGKAPKLGIVVEIDEAYTQCSKAFIRSDLWNPALHIDRDELPSAGAILRSLHDEDFDADAYNAARAERYARREGLY